MTRTLILTCEHGGNDVPPEYADLFQDHAALLDNHNAYDRGAFELAKAYSVRLHAPLTFTTVTRLLVDCNRSLHNRSLFSQVTKHLPDSEKQCVIAHYYQPYRSSVQQFIATALRQGKRIVHLSIHSFTPVYAGEIRQADIGLLYDPSRSQETALCAAWQHRLRGRLPDFRIRRNYPYLGKSDGFATFFRQHYAQEDYLGFELEVNQKHARESSEVWQLLKTHLIESFASAIQQEP